MIDRFATSVGTDPFSLCDWVMTEVRIKDHRTGADVFYLPKAEVPTHWSKNAAQICVSKYFRMTDIPNATTPIAEDGVPNWLWRRAANANNVTYGSETSVKQVLHRITGYWTYWGWKYGYFGDELEARTFYDECVYAMVMQWMAPNTPVFFNAGLYWAYGIQGNKKGMWRCDPKTGVAYETDDFFTHAGTHACHILSLSDTLLEEGGIYDNLSVEARAFATGGGVGSNFSNIRSSGELLSTGNRATGLMSFLKVFDRSAGVIKSGSNSRRAAKMVIIDIDHPEIEEFIDWKANEEKKVDALISAGYDNDYEGEAYRTVSGQNSNNSVRISNKFMKTLNEDKDWQLTSRTGGDAVKEIKAVDLWNKILKAAWRCGDPAVQFDDTFNDWNTCPNDGRIRGTNPCSEYSGLDNTSCNLASINLQKVVDSDLNVDIDKLRHVCRLLVVALDINNIAAQLPSKKLAEGVYKYRSIGIGHTGIGAVLMRAGMSYSSQTSCNFAAAVTSLMTAYAYEMSNELAGKLGSFPRYDHNKDAMMSIIAKHAELSCGCKSHFYYSITHRLLDSKLSDALCIWTKLKGLDGFRNSFVTLIQPSGTIGLLMDCDTLAVEPDYSLIKHKRLSGGGSMKIVNEGVREALQKLQYDDCQVREMMLWMLGHGTIKSAPHINANSLHEMGVTIEDLDKIDAAAKSAIELRHIMELSNVSKKNVGIEMKFSGNIFKRLNFTKEQYKEANGWICGHGTLEGAPHIKPEHLCVFDCANVNGDGQRSISWQAHVAMMAAVSPFISGSISKTVNMPNDATEKDLNDVFIKSHLSGIKCISIYRDGCKRSQPLNNPLDLTWWDPPIEDKIYFRGQRKKPPKRRLGIIEEATINDAGKHYKLWVQFFEYEDGALCEIWIDISKENPHYKLALKWWARALSNAIQYGQPLDEIGSSFLFEEGGPSGPTDHKYITYCKSIPDFVMKLMAMHYLGDTNWCRIKPPISELRCRMDRSIKYSTGITKSEMAPKRMKISNTDITKCDKCGGAVSLWPCPTCTECGYQSKGCNP